ncbi:MAG: cupredoxin domain-containing protein [Nitrososphaerota archaeon]
MKTVQQITILVASQTIIIVIIALIGLTSFNPVFAESKYVIIPSSASMSKCKSVNSCFSPTTLVISKGDSVVWKNKDSLAAHTVTNGKINSNYGNIFDSGPLKKDRSFNFKFTKSGAYPYFCTIHPWMNGEVIVEDASKTSSEDELKYKKGKKRS